MIAYTAWDSLRSIAREYDADLTLRPEGRVALAPHRAPTVPSVAMRRAVERAALGLAALLAAVGGMA